MSTDGQLLVVFFLSLIFFLAPGVAMGIDLWSHRNENKKGRRSTPPHRHQPMIAGRARRPTHRPA